MKILKIAQVLGVLALLMLSGCGKSGKQQVEESEAFEAKVMAQINSGKVTDPQNLVRSIVLVNDPDDPNRFTGFIETRGDRQADILVSVDPGTQRIAVQWPTPMPD